MGFKNQYETVFILTPVLSEAQIKDSVDKFKAVLTNAGAELVHEENWGLRKLAYEIDKKTTGHYFLLEFKAEPTVINTLEVEYRRVHTPYCCWGDRPFSLLDASFFVYSYSDFFTS